MDFLKNFEEYNNLSPELAESNPDIFKLRLIELLHTKTKLTGKAWDLLVERGETDLGRIKLDLSTWTSSSMATTGDISVGVQHLTELQSRNLIFEDQNFIGENQYLYRLSHEISHLLIPKIHGTFQYESQQAHPEAGLLLDSLIRLREQGKSLSTLGNLTHYRERGAEYQALEDYVEFLNMFLIEPDYLRRYLDFLSNQTLALQRKEMKLSGLSQESSKNLFRIVESSISFFFI